MTYLSGKLQDLACYLFIFFFKSMLLSKVWPNFLFS